MPPHLGLNAHRTDVFHIVGRVQAPVRAICGIRISRQVESDEVGRICRACDQEWALLSGASLGTATAEELLRRLEGAS